MYESDLTKAIEKLDKTAASFNRLYDLLKTLRAPGGCPWDREQTPLSLTSDLIEETFEAVDAIAQNDAEHCKEELGDVLLNTLMICYMFEQEKKFSVSDAVNELCDKLIRRHPHVFLESQGQKVAKEKADTSEKVLEQWENIKTQVEGRKEKNVLDSVPKGFPPLLKAYKYQKKAAKKGFDWQTAQGAKEKMQEEFAELCVAMKEEDKEQQIQEAGDLIFSVINYVRKLGIDPQVALSLTNKKFYERFVAIQEGMRQAGLSMEQKNIDKMEALWQKAKGNS